LRVEASTHAAGDAGLQVGARVEAELEVLAEPPSVHVSEDVRAAQGRWPEVGETFRGVSPSHQRAYQEYIEEARRPESHAKRIG
jgi:uncharacterized protein YdeI (YjbR/CyaY-like superfamily)